MLRIRYFGGVAISLSLIAGIALASNPARHATPRTQGGPMNDGAGQTILIGIGDSLTQGTADATDNYIATQNAYLQRVADALGQVLPLRYSAPLLSLNGIRISPFQTPTNLGVDGADTWSIDGLTYYKRHGLVPPSPVDGDAYCDANGPRQLTSLYDKVLFPINRLAGEPVTVMDSAEYLLNQHLSASTANKAAVILWIGNNDSSTASLGEGGSHPTFLPLPLEQVDPELTPLLRALANQAIADGELSIEPYSIASIDRNLTTIDDFNGQLNYLVDRLAAAGPDPARVDLFLLTLPYYSSIGYLFDSEDIEYYLQKVDPAYTVPASFKRVAPPGQPILDPFAGDRISLLTFGFMYLLLDSGYSVDYVNSVLETNGVQRDGLVMSEAEAAHIRDRIDGFNDIIRSAAGAHPAITLIDIGDYINQAFAGDITIVVGDKTLSRKWIRGSAFSFDGVHPGYTGHALLANYLLERIGPVLGVSAAAYHLPAIQLSDPYVDFDGDGFAPGPPYEGSGFGEALFYFKDPDDSNASIGPVIPDDAWTQLSRAILKALLDFPRLRLEAERIQSGAVIELP